MKGKEFTCGDKAWFFDTYIWQSQEGVVVDVHRDDYVCVVDDIRFNVPKNELFKTVEIEVLDIIHFAVSGSCCKKCNN